VSANYEKLKEELWAEYNECENNAFLDKLINQNLSNSSEETDFENWAECTKQSVKMHLPIIKEWGLTQ